MTDQKLKKLKDDLWHAADVLRAGAHLAANKYGQPILGLIFLRYADILYKQHKVQIEEEYNKLKGTRAEKSLKEISMYLLTSLKSLVQVNHFGLHALSSTQKTQGTLVLS